MGETQRNSSQEKTDPAFQPSSVPNALYWPFLLDWSKVISLVFGGCCTNAWALERLLLASTSIGTTLTLFQMAFVALRGIPDFLRTRREFPFVTLKPRTVPIRQWGLQVLILWSMTLLNNLALGYDVPVPLMIVFRSGGLGISMFYGYFFLHRHYNRGQVFSIILATIGVILSTVSRPTRSGSAKPSSEAEASGPYAVGILLLTTSSLLTGYLGLLQERTYLRYGRCWQEGLFYTHLLALPLFLPFSKSVYSGITALRLYSASASSYFLSITLPLYLISQLACVSGVGMLTSRVSSVSTNLILTTRKAMSLIISVALLGSSWNLGMTIGSAMVFFGGVLYGIATQAAQKQISGSKHK